MSDSGPDCAHLASCVSGYREAAARAASLRQKLSQQQLTWKPDEDTWSVVECVEHLNTTVSKQIEKMRVGVLEAHAKRQLGGSPPFGNGTWAGRFIIGGMEKGKKFKTFKSFNPIYSNLDTDDVFDRFRKTNQDLSRLALEADGLDLGKTKVGSAPTNLLKMTLAQAFRIHDVHGKRHLDQAEALRELDEFPR